MSTGPDGGRLRRRDGGPSNTGSLKSFAVAVDGAEIAALPGFRYHIGFVRQAVDRINDEDELLPPPDSGDEDADDDEDDGADADDDEDDGEDANGGEDVILVDINGILDAANATDNDGEDFLPSDEIGNEYRFVIAGQWTKHINDDLTVTPLVEYVHFWNAEGILDESRDYLTVGTLLEYRNWDFAVSYTGRYVKEPDGTRANAKLFQVSAGYTFDFGLGVGIGYRLFEEDNIRSHTAGVHLYYDYSFAL